MKKKIRIIILIISISVLGYSGYQLFQIQQQYQTGDNLYQKIEEEVFQVNEEQFMLLEEEEENEAKEKNSSAKKEEQLPDFSVDFSKLTSINDNIKGWLWIPNTVISYPLLQGEDNEKYLHITYDKQSSIFGSIFLDFRCNSDFGDSNTIIYGHNMKNGSMFGSLKQYRDESFYKKHKYIYIFQETQVLKYKIVSSYTTNVISDTYSIEYSDTDAFGKYLDMIKKYASYDTNTSIDLNDKIITLSTCTGNEETRFVVHAKLVHTFQ